jgi:hypothetical protein
MVYCCDQWINEISFINIWFDEIKVTQTLLNNSNASLIMI